jgi:hypothetical protein
MSDPKGIRKGGFRTFTARVRERIAAMSSPTPSGDAAGAVPKLMSAAGGETAGDADESVVRPRALRADKTSVRPKDTDHASSHESR